jgi:hypothetical protein
VTLLSLGGYKVLSNYDKSRRKKVKGVAEVPSSDSDSGGTASIVDQRCNNVTAVTTHLRLGTYYHVVQVVV